MPVALISHRRSVFFTLIHPRILPPALLLALCLWHAPGHAGEDAEFQRAKGYYTLQEYQLAVEALGKFVAAYPKSDRGEDAQLLLAESHYQLKNYAEAAKAFDTFLGSHPQSPRRGDALLRAVRSNYLIKDYEKCLKNALAFINENREKLKSAPPQDPLFIKMATALYHAGDSSYALKDFDKALGYWEELAASIPKSPLVPDATDGLGWIYFDRKEYAKAGAAFHFVAETPNHPRAAWAKLMEGRSLGALKKIAEALAALKLAPTLPGANKDLEAECALRAAELQLDAGQHPEALENYRRLAKDFPTLPGTAPALSAAASRMYESKHFAEAAELAGLYLALTAANAAAAPNRPALARIKARSLLTLNKTPEALEAARLAVGDSNALGEKPEYSAERAASKMLLAELAPNEAPALYKDVTEHAPLTGYALAAQYELARLAGEAGKIDEALTLSETLLNNIQQTPVVRPGAEQIKRNALFAAGEFAFRKPDYKNAARYAHEYLKLFGEKDERSDDVARKLAWSLHETGDDAGAIAVLDSALPAYPGSAHRDELLYVRALAAGKIGNAADALKFDEELIKTCPNSPFLDDALYDAAALHYKQKQLDQSLSRLDQLLEKPAPKAALKNAALQLRATARLQNGKPAEALVDAELLLKGAASDPKLNLPALRLVRALALLSTPQKETDALAALSELIEKGPADTAEVRQGIARRAYLLFKNKQFAAAKPDFITLSDPAKTAAPGEALDAALHLAVIHRELKEIPQAKALLEKLAGEKLEGVAAFEVPFQLGNLIFEAGDNASAVKHYERALADSAGNKDIALESLSAARLNLAWALKRLKENEKSETMFGELVQADPHGSYAAEALFERGRILAELGKSSEALPLWKEVQDKFADSPFAEKALFSQGQTQAQAGLFKEAAQSFELHAEKFASVNLKETLCGLGESRLRLNEFDKARDAFNKVLGPKGVEADLEDVTERALLGLADIALKSGDPSGAKKMVLRILTENAQSEWADAAYFISGQASEVLKEPEKAIGYYRKLISERPQSGHVPAAEERLRALGAPK